METFDTRKLDKLLAAYVSAKKSNSRSIAELKKSQIFQFVADQQTLGVVEAVNAALVDAEVKHRRHVSEAVKRTGQEQRDQLKIQSQTINDLATQLHKAELELQRATAFQVSNVLQADDESIKNEVVLLVIEWLSSKCNRQK